MESKILIESQLKAEMLKTLAEHEAILRKEPTLVTKVAQEVKFQYERTFNKALHALKGRWYLRGCQIQGVPKVKGKLIVRHYGGRIQVGDKVLFDADVVPVELAVRKGGLLNIARNNYINYGTSISASKFIHIGENCLIGTFCTIIDDDFHGILDRDAPPPPEPLILEDNVWLGGRVTVLKGVTIGRDSVIGAGSVVTKSVPPRSVAVGMPARVIKTF
jgi:acetyltransferase-like isoleucine patch superfamily enzyme